MELPIDIAEQPKEVEMSRFKLSVFIVMLAAFSMPALAGDKAVKRVPAGAVAFHFVADLSIRDAPPPEYVKADLVGYIAFIEGVDGPLFDESVSTVKGKDTAYFTISLTSPTPPPAFLKVETDPGLVVQFLEPAGAQFTVFYNPDPVSRDWNDPLTFQQGVPIAVFEESALLSTGVYGASFGLFSSSLVDSKPINFKGQRINFKRLVPNGVTTTNYSKPRLDEDFNLLGSSFGGTSIAIGGKPRKDSHDDDSDD